MSPESESESEPSLLLAIEAASRAANVALLRGADLVGTRTAKPGQHHAESLLPMVESLLGEVGAGPGDVDAFAVGIGPGAFTSLRIGVATVKGLAFGSDRPVAQVSTLAALAQRGFAANADCDRAIAVLDARRGFVFAGEFARAAAGGEPELQGSESLVSIEALARAAAPGAAITGEGPPRLAERLAGAGRDDLVLLEAGGPPLAAAVAELGRAAIAAGRGAKAGELVPRYLQRPQAEEARLAAEAEAG